MRELAERARNGDQEAFAGLYREVYEDLYRFALYVLKNPHDAQDAAAETVADAYASVGKLRKPEAFRPWIFKILTNKCKRRLKEYNRRDVELTEEILSGEILAGAGYRPLFPGETGILFPGVGGAPDHIHENLRRV